MSEDQIIDTIIDELHEVLRRGNLEDSVVEVTELNQENQTITIKFKYQVFVEDDYIGLASW